MGSSRFRVSRGVVIAAAVVCAAAASVMARQALPLEPPAGAGMGITPAFEGWFQNADGSYSLLMGYFNRNMKQVIDIPIGPNNRIEPGGPDLGQPTHFETRRQWGVFVIKVPKDFGTKKYTWTIVANGKTASVPVGLIKDYQVEPYKDAAMGNVPPTIKFSPTGKTFTGPPMEVAATYTATAGTPLTLEAWATDDGMEPAAAGRGGAAGRGDAAADAAGAAGAAGSAGATGAGAAGAGGGRGAAGAGAAAAGRGGPALRVSWHKYRGPGDVKFAEESPKVDRAAGGKTSTTATFSLPGEYMLRAQANDNTGEGGGGFQCCWTNAYVKVTVAGGSTTK